MNKILLCFFTSFILSISILLGQIQQSPSYSQKQNYEWAFAGSGFNFNNDTLTLLPTTFTNNNTGFVSDALASVCDNNGKLLFYTDGYGIYEGSPIPGNNNYYMPNAYPFLPGTQNVSPTGGFNQSNPTYWPATDGSVIVPVIDSPDKYYVFCEEYWSNYLYYSVVDMSLNGGYGDIEPGRKAIPIDSNLTSGMEAIVGDDCNVWLLVHDNNNTYKAYNITSNGIDSIPVASTGANSIGYDADAFCSQMVASPNGRKIATDGQLAMEISDFDPATGIISNSIFQEVSANSIYPMLAFSPDNTKLYSAVGNSNSCIGCSFGPTELVQYDMTIQGPWTPIIADTTIINSSNGSGGNMALPFCARLGPDGKIYINNRSVIDYPNLSGTACHVHFLPFAIQNAFANNTQSAFLWSFPFNVSPVLPNHDTVTTTHILVGCFGDSAVTMTASDTTGWNYTWSDYNEYRLHTNHRTIDTPAVIVLTYNTKGCTYNVDTFIVKHIDYSFHLSDDTTFCSQNSFLIKPDTVIPSATYLWQDGSTGSNYTATQTGAYWVTVNDTGCIASDTIQLRFINIDQNLGDDTSFCVGRPISMTLKANTDIGASFLWSTGSTNTSIEVDSPGIYWVYVTDGPCVASDTIQIQALYCDCTFGMPNAFTPNGDDRNDIFRPVLPNGCPVRGYQLSIYNRWGQLVFVTYNPGQGWDGKFNGIPADIGTYEYMIRFEAGTNAVPHYQKGDVTLIR